MDYLIDDDVVLAVDELRLAVLMQRLDICLGAERIARLGGGSRSGISGDDGRVGQRDASTDVGRVERRRRHVIERACHLETVSVDDEASPAVAAVESRALAVVQLHAIVIVIVILMMMMVMMLKAGRDGVQLVATDELGGALVQVNVVECLKACVVDGARTDEQRAEQVAVYGAGHERVRLIEAARVRHDQLDELHETLAEQCHLDPGPQFVASSYSSAIWRRFGLTAVCVAAVVVRSRLE